MVITFFNGYRNSWLENIMVGLIQINLGIGSFDKIKPISIVKLFSGFLI